MPLHELLDGLAEESINFNDAYGHVHEGQSHYIDANGHPQAHDQHLHQEHPPLPDGESQAGWDQGNGVESQEAAFARSLMISTTANGRSKWIYFVIINLFRSN